MKSFFRVLFSVRTIVLIVLVGAVLGGGGYLWWVSTAGASGPNYKTEAVVRKNLDATITSTGTIEPVQVIDVGAQVQGQILHFGKVKDPDNPSVEHDVDYCTEVKQGDVLAEIDPTIYQARLAQAKAAQATANAAVLSANANLSKSKTNRDNLKAIAVADANSPGAIAAEIRRTDEANYEAAEADTKVQEAAVAQAQASVDLAQANLKEAQTNLDYCTIKSPVDGVIIDRRVNVGQTVVASLSTPSLFLMAKDLNSLEIWVAVNEADIGNIHLGQDVTFTVDARPGKTYHGNVSQIRYNATMTQNVVTYTVVVSTANKTLDTPTAMKVSTKSGEKHLQTELELLPYLTANLTFHVDQRENALLVPNGALRWRPQLDQVAPAFRDEYEQSLHKKGAATTPDDTPPPAGTDNKPAKDAGGAALDKKPAKDATAGGLDNKPPPKPHDGGNSHGTVWVQDGPFVRPIRLTTGLTDGVMTEVVKVRDGDPALEEKMMLVTGENQGRGASATTNPFAPPPIFRPQQPKKPADQ